MKNKQKIIAVYSIKELWALEHLFGLTTMKYTKFRLNFNTVLELWTSMWVVVGSNPNQTELALTIVGYRFHSCSTNYIK